MKIGFIGLGKMGGKMSEKLIMRGHEVVGYDLNTEAIEKFVSDGGIKTSSLNQLIEIINKNEEKIVWVMLPAGKITEDTLNILKEKLHRGAIVIDGGNSKYTESIKHGKIFEEKGLKWLDVGTSGGLWGFEKGYCLMVGGDEDAYKKVEPILKDLSRENGYAYVGEKGSGHFVKMVHNGIEYGMMQAYGEGFEILNSSKEFDINLEKIAKLWQEGSIIESFLLGVSKNIFDEDPKLEKIKGYVEDSGEGRWTVETAIDLKVSAPVITMALMQRFRSRKVETFTDKVIAKMRNEFGGHKVKEGKNEN